MAVASHPAKSISCSNYNEQDELQFLYSISTKPKPIEGAILNEGISMVGSSFKYVIPGELGG